MFFIVDLASPLVPGRALTHPLNTKVGESTNLSIHKISLKQKNIVFPFSHFPSMYHSGMKVLKEFYSRR